MSEQEEGSAALEADEATDDADLGDAAKKLDDPSVISSDSF
jgi:hypothetical protein